MPNQEEIARAEGQRGPESESGGSRPPELGPELDDK